MNDVLRPHAHWIETSNRRKVGRIEIRHLRTRLGRVIDIGPGGMRLRGKPWPPLETYGPIDVELHGMTEVLPIKVTVAWSSRPTMFTRELGLAFVDLSDHARHALAGLFAVCEDASRSRAG
ncbi:MAG: PilZ domain-containing protein [Phycisphaerales bacterium JB060]